MTLESRIALYGSLVVIILFGIVIISSAPSSTQKEANCRMYLAETTDRSLEEIHALCKQP